MRAVATGAAALAALLTACLDNSAPGNDREAALDAPEPAAEVADAGAALAGVDVGLVMPEIMTDADLARAPADASRCRFRMTRVGFPVVAYDASAVVKLNGRLVPLAGSGDGHYGAGGIDVTVRPLEEAPDRGGQFEAEFVLRLPGAPNELGFHGFAACAAAQQIRGS